MYIYIYIYIHNNVICMRLYVYKSSISHAEVLDGLLAPLPMAAPGGRAGSWGCSSRSSRADARGNVFYTYHVRVYMYICAYIYIYTHVCEYIYIYIYTHTCTSSIICYMNQHVYVYAEVYVYVYVCVYIYTPIYNMFRSL